MSTHIYLLYLSESKPFLDILSFYLFICFLFLGSIAALFRLETIMLKINRTQSIVYQFVFAIMIAILAAI